ncbi:hypothetical protein [Mycobacterium hubeiense]|uniref:hypothetical protein n=1 Tax=Mycobacterium hubeiense TaxID=1867256 RepID=UPI000C7EEE4F|nr:hypothetical protein [Mycobacterium sp. QGD 101]
MVGAQEGPLDHPHVVPPRATAHTSSLQSILLVLIAISGIVGVVAFILMGQPTVAFIIGLISAAIIAGTVC